MHLDPDLVFKPKYKERYSANNPFSQIVLGGLLAFKEKSMMKKMTIMALLRAGE